jgi:hypothetical protein
MVAAIASGTAHTNERAAFTYRALCFRRAAFVECRPRRIAFFT